MVRESIFNILGSAVEDARVLDLFAGTGALGLEALSRGASRVLFVERDREHAALIRRNLATLRYEDRAHVAVGDAYRWVRGFESAEEGPLLVFADPPYVDFERRSKQLRELVEGLVAKLPVGSILTVESSWSREEDRVLPEIGLWDIRKHGGTRVAIRVLGEVDPGEPGSAAGGWNQAGEVAGGDPGDEVEGGDDDT